MQTRRLGQSGLALSVLSLGTLTWGRDTETAEALEMFHRFVEAGGTTLDVPSSYRSEVFASRGETVASVIAGTPGSDPVIVLHSNDPTPATPVRTGSPMTSAPCSRRTLLRSLDHDLATLGRRSVDVWVVHGPRLGVSHKEIAEAMLAAVNTGRVSYVGLADMEPWDIGAITALLAETPAQVRSIAAPFSLLNSSPQTSLLPHCAEEGIGFIALSPLAGGTLTGKYKHSTPTDSRAASSHLGAMMQNYMGDDPSRVVEAVLRVADGLGVSASAVALAWVSTQQAVATCAVGPRNLAQLEATLDGHETRLPRELRDALAEVSIS